VTAFCLLGEKFPSNEGHADYRRTLGRPNGSRSFVKRQIETCANASKQTARPRHHCTEALDAPRTVLALLRNRRYKTFCTIGNVAIWAIFSNENASSQRRKILERFGPESRHQCRIEIRDVTFFRIHQAIGREEM
jgi:hypothetical protein